MRRIVLVSNRVYHYRVPVYNHLHNRLRSIGYELLVITSELQEDNPHDVEFPLVEERPTFSSYRELIVANDPAAVILFLHIKDVVVWPLLAWLKLRKTNVIYWNHGINLETPNNALKNRVFGIFHSAADAILLYSENEKQFIARRHWRKLFVANNTLNFDAIPPIHESKEELRRQLGIPFERVVLFVGRIEPNKRLGDLLEAARLLNDGIGVVIVGGGLSAEHAAQIDSLPNVSYLGEIYDATRINQLFKLADVFSIPGKMGLGINHAFYWGLPVITEDVLHAPEIVYLKKNRNGFIVGKGDTAALAARINSLLGSKRMYADFSQAARTEIMRSANIDTMCDGFVDALHYLEQRAG